MKGYLFFDNASTTKCCDAAALSLQRFAQEDYGNPSSSHSFGQKASRAIRDARLFFAEVFNIEPDQVIFTGSGTEADNLAIYGIARSAVESRLEGSKNGETAPRVICSEIEHPAVRKTALSLSALGLEVKLAPVNQEGQLQSQALEELLAPQTILLSVHQVNNIIGTVFPIEDLARRAKAKVPGVVFHTDAVQAFGKIPHPTGPSAIDLVSISAHKIGGPKGVGALIVMSAALLRTSLRPLLWGGDQEGGLRSGTQSAGHIVGFQDAAKRAVSARSASAAHILGLRRRLEERLRERGLLEKQVRWNSPSSAVPHIVSLSVPGCPSGALARLLEERRCIVSTGSACGSRKVEPEPVLAAMGLPPEVQASSIRISFSDEITAEDVDTLVRALEESISAMSRLLGTRSSR